MRQEAVTVLRLDASQHNAAAAEAGAAIGRIGTAAGTTARQTAQAMRSLPAQFTDVATQLAGGQNPLLILLQQGGQVRDQFGSIGAAVRGIGSFITPTTLGVGAVAALGAALIYADRDAERFRNTLSLTGNAAGLTADRLNEMADRVGEASGRGSARARELVTEMAATGRISADVLESSARVAIRVQELSGQSAKEVASQFAGQRADIVAWAAKANETYNFLTVEQFKYIVALKEQGRTAEAVIAVNDQLQKSLDGQGKGMTLLKALLPDVALLWYNLGDAIRSAAAPATTLSKLEDERARLAKILKDGEPAEGSLSAGQVQVIRQRILLLAEQAKQESTGAQTRAAAARQAIQDIQDETEALRKKEAAAKSAAALAARAFDTTPGPVNLNIMDARDALAANPYAAFNQLYPAADVKAITAARDPNRQFRVDELSSYDAVDRAAREAENQRLERKRQTDKQLIDQQALFLQELVDTNARANIDLIADDQQRAIAQIALERQQLQRRIEAIYASGPDRIAAERAADATTAAKIQSVGIRFAKDTALVTREETRDALAAAFQDSKNPLKAFGDALGNIVFQRVSTALADALLTAVLGPAGGGGGGLFGSLLGGLGSIFGLPSAVSGAVSGLASGATLDAAFDLGPIPKLATGTNYVPRDMLAMLHKGEAVLPKRYNPAAGGGSQAASTNVVEIHQTLNIGQGVGRAEVAAAMVQAKEAAKGELMQLLERERVLR